MGQQQYWQYSYFPNTTCVNCTVRISSSFNDYSLDAYLILHGEVKFNTITAKNLEIYSEDLFGNKTKIGSLKDLNTNYTGRGYLWPLFSAYDGIIRFENYYKAGVHSVFPDTIEFLIRLRPKDLNCSEPLVYVLPSPSELTFPVLNDNDFSCYFSLYFSDANTTSLTFQDWNLEKDDQVTIIPGLQQLALPVADNSTENQINTVAFYIKATNAAKYEGFRVTTPRVNLLIKNFSNFSVTITTEKPKDYYAKRLVGPGDNGSFMCSYPEYHEVEMVSKTGDIIHINLELTADLSENATVLLTEGSDGNQKFLYESPINKETVGIDFLQFNFKFTPKSSKSSFVVARYTITKGNIC
ncbi:unnamed protein product [Enterobius vermicularis]|uniref:CUB_2 domain-containing protein n=1 Tax=Enterobius vermicularis TaxID=51028 RepID=A0A0N4V4J8_ENTVE|nr:unnamed protein product [Enterobius vermicularis]